MRTLFRNIILGAALAAFTTTFATTAAAQSTNPGMGSWKLNVGKSKYSPGPAPQSLTARFEPAGQGVKLTTEGVAADGSRTATEYTANYDGKDYPLKGSPLADTVSLKRVDTWTSLRTDKKNGKTVVNYKRVVAKDGKSFTVEITGTNAKGEPFNNMLVFDRQ
jgi:hypothetical protein